jgi:DNA-binding MarR family transcriptional regulator
MPGRLMELISRAHLQWKRRVARDLLPHGVSPKQVYLLRRLRDEGPLTPSAIADLVFADRPSVTSMLGTLERAGWIGRRRDPANRRRVLVDITPEGTRKLASVPERLWRSGRTRFDPEAGLTPSERAAAIRLLEKLNTWLER